MSTFYSQLMSLSMPERQAIADAANLSLAYIHKHTYVSNREPKFHFHNAVAMDAASCGLFPFMQHTAGQIDWAFVYKRLGAAKRKGLF